MSVKSELLALQRASKDHVLQPRAVVEWARSHPKSALHSRFNWNIEEAAFEFWVNQARQIITLTIVSVEHKPQMISLSIDRPSGGGYRHVDAIVKSRNMSEIMLRDAIAALDNVKKRYHYVRALVSVWKALDEIRPEGCSDGPDLPDKKKPGKGKTGGPKSRK
jgi:hypothetical protein